MLITLGTERVLKKNSNFFFDKLVDFTYRDNHGFC